MIFDKIDSFVERQQLIQDKPSIVLGLSGGPDSLLLLHYLTYLRKQEKIDRLIAAHLDHEWRENSASDALFCKELCQALNVSFISGRLSELGFSKKNLSSKEEIGRKARRIFLEKIRLRERANLIALGHHLQDQEETFFIRVIRGSSLTGLTGIRPQHGVYIRPLLEISKSDIIQYLYDNKIPYLTDPTNQHFDYLRNRIRATVLPALQQVDNRFDQNFLVTINRLRETEEFLEELTQQTFASIAIQDAGKWNVDGKALRALPHIMQYRVLMHWLIQEHVPFSPSQAFLDEIFRFINTSASKDHLVHEQWKLVKRKQKLTIEMR